MLLEGEPCTFDHSSAIGKWGPIFLELIELHEVTPELESRYYTGGAGGSNIAHVAYIVDDPAAEGDRLEAAGMPRFLYPLTNAKGMTAKVINYGGGNIAHVAYVADDFAAEGDHLEAAGMPKFLYLRQGPVQISVHDAPLLGHALEVLENTDEVSGLFGIFAAADEGWDGSEPLREMPEG